MFQLKLISSNGLWTSSLKLSSPACRSKTIEDFYLTWKGVNHTVISYLNDHRGGGLPVYLLIHKQGMIYRAGQSLYPVMDFEFGKFPAKNCPCLNGSEFDYRKTWHQLCPETNDGKRSLFFSYYRAFNASNHCWYGTYCTWFIKDCETLQNQGTSQPNRV